MCMYARVCVKSMHACMRLSNLRSKHMNTHTHIHVRTQTRTYTGLCVPVCTTCEIVKPIRSKHARVTNVCVFKFDHFCPWMGVAIGERNYR